jgi:small subunit ribosomal protein S20
LQFVGIGVIIYSCTVTKGGVTMPNIKSSKKRVDVNLAKAQRNKSRNSALKTAIKKANAAIDTGAENRDELVKIAIKKIDQAAAKGLLHKNNAAHKKSALVSKCN